MALRRDLTYPARYDAATPSQPQGAFKNRSAPAVLDGSYLEEGWLNDWSGFFGRLLTKAGFTANGNQDTALDSQYMDALEQVLYKRVQRNFINNGDFQVAQRGDVFVPTATQSYTLDQWKVAITLDGGLRTNNAVSRETFGAGQIEVPNNPKHYMNFSGYVGAGGAAKSYQMRQLIEGVNKFSGETVTLSYWIKGSIVGDYSLAVEQAFGSGGAPSGRVVCESEVVSVGVDWEKKTHTFVMPSILGKTIGNDDNDSILMEWFTDMGATQAAFYGLPATTYIGTLSIADIQFEKGAVPTDYERLNVATQKLICQRYFSRFQQGSDKPVMGFGFGINVVRTTPFRLSTTMRVTPSVTRHLSVYPFLTWSQRLVGNTSSGITNCEAIPLNQDEFDWNIVGAGLFTNESPYGCVPVNQGTVVLYFSAEL